MSRVRIGVVGGGHLGRIHTRLLKGLPEFDLVAVAEPVAETRQAIAEQFGVATVADYHVLAGQVDAIVIASPTSLHYSMALWALRHGLHTFVEKPLVKSQQEARELNRLASKQGCVLQVGHVEQFNPAWTTSAEYIQSPHIIEAVRESSYTGRSTDIGVVLDLMIHDLDLILSVETSDVISVDAKGWSVLGQHEDIAQARIEFASGCAANVRASRISRSLTRRMQIFSPEAQVDIDFGANTSDVVRTSREVMAKQWQADMLPATERLQVKDQLFSRWMPHQRLEIQPANAIELELVDFGRAIRTGSVPKVDGRQAERVLGVAERILQTIHYADSQPATIPMTRAA
ncbi:MAG: Gfo/Idh/MocA family oxidoreductase [Pirellulales bacterium]